MWDRGITDTIFFLNNDLILKIDFKYSKFHAALILISFSKVFPFFCFNLNLLLHVIFFYSDNVGFVY